MDYALSMFDLTSMQCNYRLIDREVCITYLTGHYLSKIYLYLIQLVCCTIIGTLVCAITDREVASPISLVKSLHQVYLTNRVVGSVYHASYSSKIYLYLIQLVCCTIIDTLVCAINNFLVEKCASHI